MISSAATMSRTKAVSNIGVKTALSQGRNGLLCFGRTLPRDNPGLPPKPDDGSEAGAPYRTSLSFAVRQEWPPQIAVTNLPRTPRQ